MDPQEYIRVLKQRKTTVLLFSLAVFMIYLVQILKNPQKYAAHSILLVTGSSASASSFASIAMGGGAAKPSDELELMDPSTLASKVVKAVQTKHSVKNLTEQEVSESVTRGLVGSSNLIRISVLSTDKLKAYAIAREYTDIVLKENEIFAKQEFRIGKQFIEKQLKIYTKRMEKIQKDLRDFNEKQGVVDFQDAMAVKYARIRQWEMEIVAAQVGLTASKALIADYRAKLSSTPEYKISFRVVPDPERERLKRELALEQTKLYELEKFYTGTHPEVQAIKSKITDIQDKLETNIKNSTLIEENKPLYKAGPVLKSSSQTGVSVQKKALILEFQEAEKFLNSEFVKEKTPMQNPEYDQYLRSLSHEEMNELSLDVKTMVLSSLLKQDQQELKSSIKILTEYMKLKEEETAIKGSLLQLVQTYEQMKISEASKLGNLKIVSLPKSAVAVGRFSFMQFLVVILLSISGGGAWAFLLESLDDTVRTRSHIRRYLNLPVFGAVPTLKNVSDVLLLDMDVKSPLSELYMKICFQLQSMCLEHGYKALLFSSGSAHEGKSSILVNMAISFARSGEKVIVVDVDLRRPILHKIFGLQNLTGLTSILGGQIENTNINGTPPSALSDKELSFMLDKIMCPTSTPNLYFIPCGPLVPNPVEFLRSKTMVSIVQLLKQKADFVLMDSAPLMAVIDAPIIASYVDGCIFVVDGLKTKKADAIHAKHTLASSPKIRILGSILNHSQEEVEKYYYYYTRYGGTVPSSGRKRLRTR